MIRISEKQLRIQIDYLNKITNNKNEAYTRTSKGLTGNIGHYRLDIAYGGYALVQIVNEGGAITTICERGTKRELFYLVRAFIDGYQACQRAIELRLLDKRA